MPTEAQAQVALAEHQLLSAGVQAQQIEAARALGLDAASLLGLLTKFLPVILQVLQQVQAAKGGGQVPAAAP